MKNHQNRKLAEFENTFSLLDQIDSREFAIAAEIEGMESVEVWEQALGKLQQHHPLFLNAVIDRSSSPTNEYIESNTIPLRVFNVEEEHCWEHLVKAELSTRFSTSETPLLRAVLIQKPTKTIIILTGSLIIADDAAMSYLFHDLLSSMTGKEWMGGKPYLHPQETVGLPQDVASAGPDGGTPLANVFKNFGPKVSSVVMDAAKTSLLIKKARIHGTTIHGAICAAVLLAARTLRKEWWDRKIEVISPISSKKAVEPNDSYSPYIKGHPVYLDGEQQHDFWEVARQTITGIGGANTREQVRNYINFFRDQTFESTDIQRMINILKNAFKQEIMVTSLGKLKYGTDFGPLKLNAIYGPIVRSDKGMEQTLSAKTCNDALCLTNTSDNPIEGLLETIIETLTKACKSDHEIAKL
ncbi:MAG: condensation protein [Chitinophagaceae bacterium]|nr:MAG: condensation protein [Chitinophagaceae bacterium]